MTGTALSDTRSSLGRTVIRDSVSAADLGIFSLRGCGGFNILFGEYPPTLADALDYISKNKIRMVVMLDIQGLDIARAALDVVNSKQDDAGRSFINSVVFKMPLSVFPNGTSDFTNTFGTSFNKVNFIPVINTADVAPKTATITDTEDGGFDVSDVGNFGLGGEDGIVNMLRHFEADFLTVGGVGSHLDIIAVEVNIKEPGGILTTTVLPTARTDQNTASGVAKTVGAFNPVGEFYPNGDTTQTPQFFRSSNGSCCDVLAQYLYNNPNGTGPIDPTQPVDHSDQRTNPNLFLSQGFQYIITDDPNTVRNLLVQSGKRNICSMEPNPTSDCASGGFVGPTCQPDSNCTAPAPPCGSGTQCVAPDPCGDSNCVAPVDPCSISNCFGPTPPCSQSNAACQNPGTIGSTPPPPVLIVTSAPAANFNFGNWELQLPTGSPGSPTTISSSQLQSGFQDQFFFTNSADGALGMKDPGTNCVTTPNSAHCRTELREMNTDGSPASWSPGGTNKLNATLKVEDAGGSVVIGQVHLADNVSVRPVAELYCDSAGNITVGVEQTTAGGNQVRTFLGQIPIGTLFSYGLTIPIICFRSVSTEARRFF